MHKCEPRATHRHHRHHRPPDSAQAPAPPDCLHCGHRAEDHITDGDGNVTQCIGTGWTQEELAQRADVFTTHNRVANCPCDDCEYYRNGGPECKCRTYEPEAPLPDPMEMF